MRRFLVATLVVGGVVALIGVALLTTLRAQASGPLAVSNADLLDMGSLARLRTPLVSNGGRVLRVLPHGALVTGRGGRPLTIIFSPHAIFLQAGASVGQSAVEPGSHLSMQGLSRDATTFAAYKVRVSPHHRAIGGLIVNAAAGLLTIADYRAGLSLVKVLPAARVTFGKQPFLQPLRAGLRVRTRAVPDPILRQHLYLADAVQVLRPTQSVRVGGVIRAIDAPRNRLTIYNATRSSLYTVEVVSATHMTLNKWRAEYGDMALGDHVTVVGKVDPAPRPAGPNPLVARLVRLSSPSFRGTIVTITQSLQGGIVLGVRARRGHVLQIDAAGHTPVLYGAQLARVADLQVGEHISASGQRAGKFELVAAKVRVYLRQHTVGGAVASVLPGKYRIVDANAQRQYIIHANQHTVYTLNGKPATAAAIKVGLHVRARGFDALHGDGHGIATVDAARVSVTVHTPRHHTHRTAKKKPARKKSVAKTAHP